MLKSCALQNGKVPLVSILLCAELADESHMQAVGAYSWAYCTALVEKYPQLSY